MTAETCLYALRSIVERGRPIGLQVEQGVWHLAEGREPPDTPVTLANGNGLEDVIEQALTALLRRETKRP